MGRQELLGIFGGLTLVLTPYIYVAVDITLNSESQTVQTSRGSAVVRTWSDGRGREIYIGGVGAVKTWRDKDLDGKLDDVRVTAGTPRRGFFTAHYEITEKEQNFYSEAVNQ